jgi:hypothetical protein
MSIKEIVPALFDLKNIAKDILVQSLKMDKLGKLMFSHSSLFDR